MIEDANAYLAIILGLVGVIGAIITYTKFFYKKGVKAGTVEACLETMSSDIVEVKADLKTHLQEVPKLIKTNDEAHNALDKKIEENFSRVQKSIIYLCVKTIPDFKPSDLD